MIGTQSLICNVHADKVDCALHRIIDTSTLSSGHFMNCGSICQRLATTSRQSTVLACWLILVLKIMYRGDVCSHVNIARQRQPHFIHSFISPTVRAAVIKWAYLPATHTILYTTRPTIVIPKLWPAGHFWPSASYKMASQDLWSRTFYLHHISV